MPLELLEPIVKRQAWLATARRDQLPPPAGTFLTWLLMAGRGSGKTRAGAEEIWWPAAFQPQRIAVIGPTSGDVRKTCFEGESGLLACIPDSLVDRWSRSTNELWLKPPPGYTEGSYFVGYSSEEPERLRGPQHHRAWCDELAAWKYPEDTWDMMLYGLRLGDDPQAIVTTTPKPIKLVKDLVRDHDTVVAKASTFDNAAHLPEKILKKFREKFEGTRMGRQELYAEILEDNPYALWKMPDIDGHRVIERIRPQCKRIVVSVDPPITTGEKADECGIAVTGVRHDGHFVVLGDFSEQGLLPHEWGARVAEACYEWGTTEVIAEANQGGEMVRAVIEGIDSDLDVDLVWATKGKRRRAEPIASLYPQGRVHHYGRFATMEQQMCEMTSDFDQKAMGYSPDRVDALVWGLTALLADGGSGSGPGIRSL